LSLAEKYIKLYNAKKDGTVMPADLSVTDQRGEVRKLEMILDPLVLTDERREQIGGDLFSRSLLC
jgi:hypothetical protein